MMFKQLQRKLARESRELTLSRAPARTLYYFGLTLVRGARQGAHWCISHPVMLFLVLPALALYLAAKHSHYAPDTVQTIEVCGLRNTHRREQVHGGGVLVTWLTSAAGVDADVMCAGVANKPGRKSLASVDRKQKAVLGVGPPEAGSVGPGCPGQIRSAWGGRLNQMHGMALRPGMILL